MMANKIKQRATKTHTLVRLVEKIQEPITLTATPGINLTVAQSDTKVECHATTSKLSKDQTKCSHSLERFRRNKDQNASPTR